MKEQQIHRRYQIKAKYMSVAKGFDAYHKSRHDVTETLSKVGFTPLDLVFPTGNSSVGNRLRFYRNIIKAGALIARPDVEEVVIQHPINDRFIPRLIMRYLMWRGRKAKVTLLIHDIDSLREQGEISALEKSYFNRADRLIIHTPAMARYLRDNGVTTPLSIINLFDYYATSAPDTVTESGRPVGRDSIVFAGNLVKSPFLTLITPDVLSRHLYLYGATNTQYREGISYEGKFHPDHIADIKGDWGLVWDGSAQECKESVLGDYLRFNASHKASLYIASGKPIIVWRQSAIADFIVSNHLGIAVDNLSEIDATLDRLTEKDLIEIANAVRTFSRRLLTGQMLIDALSPITPACK